MINGATANIDGFVSLKNYVIFVPGALLKLVHSCMCLTSASGLWVCGTVPPVKQSTSLHAYLKSSE